MTAKIVDVNTETDTQIVPSQIQENTIMKQLKENEKTAIDSIKKIRKMKKEIQMQQNPTEPKQKKLTYNQALRQTHRDIARNFMEVLRAMDVSIKPKHVINPLAIRHDGLSGDGERQIIKNLFFMHEDSTEPQTVNLFEDIPKDAVLYAEESIGYITVTVKFKDKQQNDHTIIGKSICSAHDHYNGNFGLNVALRNAFDQIKHSGIDTPIVNLSDLVSSCQDMIALSCMFENQ